MKNTVESVLIIGLGMIGSSIALASRSKGIKVYGYDLDMFAIKTSNFLFDYEKSVKAITSDIWTKKPKYLDDTNLIINTSCEHMPPMKDWEYYKEGIFFFKLFWKRTEYDF